MKKLRLIAIILLVIVFFVGCKKTGDKEDSDIDSLKNVENVTISDTSLIIEDNKTDQISQPIEEDIPDTTSLVKEDDWEYEKLRVGEGAMLSGRNLGNLPVQSRVKGLSRSSVDLGGVELGSGSISSSGVARQNLSGSVNMSDRLARNSSDALGFSVGGAKDINNFRENIKNNYMPVEEDITHEGIFYDYFFDNNITKQAKHLFEPAYTSYKNKHPLTNEEEIYLSVGLNSNLTKSSFERKKLNLTIVLDISGSMSSSFDNYYYDGRTRKKRYDDEDFDTRSKMEIAKECINDLTKHLTKDDRFAVVLFDNSSYLAKPFNLVGNTDMDAIRSHINEIHPRGGTNMYAGINTATELYDKLPKYDPKEYDNRIIFLTDAMPNTDVTNENSLWGVMKNNADNRIHTTFIGVGVDLNSELIKYITRTPGANYYSVHSAKEFKKRMDTQFDFMVTPLVFDLTLHLKSDNYQIEEVFGSPEADKATGEIMRVNTLFPSESEDGKTRGGIILIKLKKTGWRNDIELTCSYKDRNGVPELVNERIKFSQATRGTDNGIRKAVLLSRYVNLMHDWINNKTSVTSGEGTDDWQYGNNTSQQRRRPRSRWERNSQKLAVNSYYKEQFSRFKLHFAKEATDIEDEDLRQELDILEKLADY
ncbi:VWA domain-containing protein [bacterium]|nr:VWA domain-containing protein [bacterium]